MSISSRQVHYNPNMPRPVVKRSQRWRVLSKEVLELAIKITLTVVIGAVALALIVGFVALCIWGIVSGVNDIADNGFNAWSAAWVMLGIFGLSGTPSVGNAARRRGTR